jgi:hypothetical protein
MKAKVLPPSPLSGWYGEPTLVPGPLRPMFPAPAVQLVIAEGFGNPTMPSFPMNTAAFAIKSPLAIRFWA